jgi:hypothetical protein
MTDEERKERQRASNRKWYAVNREKIAERQRKYYEKNREKLIQDAAKWKSANPEKGKDYSRKHYAANREKRIESSTKWRASNTEKAQETAQKYYETTREKQIADSAKWKAANREKVRAQKRRRHAKKKADPVYQMAGRVRARMKAALTRNGFSKESTTAKMLGCSWKQFTKHIESHFTDGMGWHNKSEWHLDHILPLSCATTIEGLEKLSHYTNIRPLWAAENLRKSDNLVLMS